MQLNSVAIIPDGNRRFADKSGLSKKVAYMQGFRNVERSLEWAEEHKIKDVSFWALSLENFTKRSKLELRLLFELMSMHVKDALAKINDYEDKEVKVSFFGRTDLLPPNLRERISELESRTSRFNKRRLSIGIAYSGREELVNAAKNIAVDFKENRISKIDEEAFSKYLYYPDSPDLIIRAGRVKRLSGFMPWQNAYSELYFSDKLWPEFDSKEFDKAVGFYYDSERRFGK